MLASRPACGLAEVAPVVGELPVVHADDGDGLELSSLRFVDGDQSDARAEISCTLSPVEVQREPSPRSLCDRSQVREFGPCLVNQAPVGMPIGEDLISCRFWQLALLEDADELGG